jgi:hypothetical protein
VEKLSALELSNRCFEFINMQQVFPSGTFCSGQFVRTVGQRSKINPRVWDKNSFGSDDIPSSASFVIRSARDLGFAKAKQQIPRSSSPPAADGSE